MAEKKVIHQMTEEVMRSMLEEIGKDVGLQWPETSDQVYFFKSQVPLLVKACAKKSVFWDRECELIRLKVYGR